MVPESDAPDLHSRPRHERPESPRDGRTAGSAPSPGDVAAPRGVPQRVGRYRVLRELGRGGMGVVYLGEDSTLGRKLAIKVLSADLAADATRLARFEREARLLASLNHPNIAVVHSFEHDRQDVFMTMEFVEGESLESRLERTRLSVAETLDLIRQVADALDAAHERGVVHRDLKPANVMLTASGRVKILDFGLAKSVMGAGAVSESLTLAGAILGTLGYASPEQLRSEDVDERTDLWAFGCVAYQCLTGRPPFPGRTTLEVIDATLGASPDWTALPVDVPDDVRALIESCLARDRDDRPSDMTAVCNVLNRTPGTTIPRPRRDPAEVPHNLPRPISSFVGRRAQLGELGELIRSERLCSLVGPGGCGKTRLSIEFACRNLGEFPQGVWFVELAPFDDAAALLGAVAMTIGVRKEEGRTLTQTIVRTLADAPALLVLDNCEHLIDACAELVTACLEAGSALRILTTSREPLRVRGECVHRLPPLELPAERTSHALDELKDVEAVRLFSDRAASAGAGFELDDTNAADVVEICRRLDGIPLALELAAARTPILSVAEIADRLGDRFRLLTSGTRGALPHHQTLRVSIDWSHELLSPAEQSLFRRLAVFSGGWTLPSAEAVCAFGELAADDILDVSGSLIARSLVEVSRDRLPAPGGPRYSMLETIRAYALERLAESSDRDPVERHHRDHILELVERAAPMLSGSAQAEWFDRLAAEHDNLVAVLFRCLDRGDVGAAVRIVEVVSRFWRVRGHWAIGRLSCTRVLEHPGCPASSTDRAIVLECAGKLEWKAGEAELAERYFEEALEIATRVGAEAVTANALRGLGSIAQQHGDHAKAGARLEESLEIARRLGDEIGVAEALNALGSLSHASGDLTRASARFEESLDIWRQAEDGVSAANVLNNLAVVAMRRGDFDRALELFGESLGHARAVRDEHAVAATLNNLGMVAHMMSDDAGARGYFESALEIRRRMKNPWGVALALRNLGEVTDDPDEATALQEESLAIAKRLGDREGIANCLGNLGSLAAARGDHVEAVALQAEQLEILRDLENRVGVIESLESLGLVLVSLGRLAPAVRTLAAAGSLRERARAPLPPADHTRLDRGANAAREGLDAREFETAWTEGRAMSADAAVDSVLAEAGRHAPAHDI